MHGDIFSFRRKRHGIELGIKHIFNDQRDERFLLHDNFSAEGNL